MWCGVSRDTTRCAMQTGVYEKPANLVPTISPAIDIQVPYNIERLFYLMANEVSPHPPSPPTSARPLPSEM